MFLFQFPRKYITNDKYGNQQYPLCSRFLGLLQPLTITTVIQNTTNINLCVFPMSAVSSLFLKLSKSTYKLRVTTIER